MDINSISSTAFEGLQMAQAGMLVTSQNVSGSSVDGYSKRSANAVIDSMAPNAMNLSGTAFATNGFIRQYNSLVGSQLLNQQANSGYTDTLVQYTSSINSLVANSSTGLQTSIANFFNAMGTYATNPTSQAAQSGLTGSATQVAAGMAGMVSMVSQLSSNAKSGLVDSVNQVNTLLPQLAQVNQQIVNSNAGGSNTGVSPDMLDQRDQILSKLQTLVGGQTLINSDGTATQIVGGMPLVERGTANKLSINTPDNPSLSVQFAPQSVNGGKDIQQIQAPTTGQIGALMTLSSQFVPLLNQRLNTLAQSLVSIANNVSGASANSNGALSIFGFKTGSGTVGDTRAVGGDVTNRIPAITSDTAMSNLYQANATDSLGLVANGLTAANFISLAPSDNTNYTNQSGVTVNGISPGQQFITSAAANTASQYSTVMGNGVANLVSDVGVQVATWTNNQTANQAVLSNLQSQQSAISGVNLDEEAANLLKFQQLYQASSKVLQAGNEMFQSILTIMV
jgi:flagellar hook-associated protein 1 FlgK